MTRRNSLSILISPACLVLAGLTILPSLGIIVVSFLRWTGNIPPHGPSLVNFAEMRHDPWIKNSLRVTFCFAILSSVFEIFVGLIIAFLLENWSNAKNSLRLIFALPLLISSSTVGVIWRLVLNEESGPIKQIFALLGWPQARPLSSSLGALVSLCAIDVWQWTPFVILVFSFAIEVSRLRFGELVHCDELSFFSGIVHIWLPQILPIIGLVTLFRLTDCLKAFDVAQTTTAGGPGAATETISLYTYKQLISFGRFGYSAALAILLLFISSAVFSMFSRGFFQRWTR